MLHNRVYIVTGGATGIGAGIVRVLESYEAKTAIFQPDTCDVRDPKAVARGVAAVIERYGRLDGLVNNAAITGVTSLAPFLSASPEHIEDVLSVNVKGVIYCSQEAARYAVGAGTPLSIVNISSVGAYAAQEHAAVYCASKAAITALTQAMSLELATHRIRVNAVAPGDVATAASAPIAAAAPQRPYARLTPLGRQGTPTEIGEAVAFLLSDRASFITGSTLLADGGFLSY